MNGTSSGLAVAPATRALAEAIELGLRQRDGLLEEHEPARARERGRLRRVVDRRAAHRGDLGVARERADTS